ncbi:metallophosphoesterase [Streptomyces sp. NPDC059063]|uniref:metallophosphoesterase n=1 Tax=unclassified Streptomyces TaxID=2593676 RepID=UPI0036872294
MGVVRVVLVVIGVAAVFGGLLWYVWRRMVRDTTVRGSWGRRAGTVAFFAGPALMFAALAAERGGAPFLLQQILAWPGFLWMAFALYLLLALLAGELVRPLVRRWVGKARPAIEDEARSADEAGKGAQPHTNEGDREEGSRDLTRRLFVARTVAAGAATAAAATVGYGTYEVLRGPRVKRVTVPLAKLPRAAHGFRIAVVSDIHLGPVLGEGFARRVVDTVNSTQPDLIAIVGDLVDGDVEDLAGAARPLADLRARHGSFFVTSNLPESHCPPVPRCRQGPSRTRAGSCRRRGCAGGRLSRLSRSTLDVTKPRRLGECGGARSSCQASVRAKPTNDDHA